MSNAIETWTPVMVIHEMSTDEAPAREALPRPIDGLLNVRVLVTDATGAVSGMDAGNVSEETVKSVLSALIREHAADVKKVLAATPEPSRG